MKSLPIYMCLIFLSVNSLSYAQSIFDLDSTNYNLDSLHLKQFNGKHVYRIWIEKMAEKSVWRQEVRGYLYSMTDTSITVCNRHWKEITEKNINEVKMITVHERDIYKLQVGRDRSGAKGMAVTSGVSIATGLCVGLLSYGSLESNAEAVTTVAIGVWSLLFYCVYLPALIPMSTLVKGDHGKFLSALGRIYRKTGYPIG